MILDDDLYFSNYDWMSKVGITSRAIYLFTFTLIATLWINLVNEFVAIKK